ELAAAVGHALAGDRAHGLRLHRRVFARRPPRVSARAGRAEGLTTQLVTQLDQFTTHLDALDTRGSSETAAWRSRAQHALSFLRRLDRVRSRAPLWRWFTRHSGSRLMRSHGTRRPLAGHCDEPRPRSSERRLIGVWNRD